MRKQSSWKKRTPSKQKDKHVKSEHPVRLNSWHYASSSFQEWNKEMNIIQFTTFGSVKEKTREKNPYISWLSWWNHCCMLLSFNRKFVLKEREKHIQRNKPERQKTDERKTLWKIHAMKHKHTSWIKSYQHL